MHITFSTIVAEACAQYIRQQFRQGNLPEELSDGALFYLLQLAGQLYLDRHYMSMYHVTCSGENDWLTYPLEDNLSPAMIVALDTAIEMTGGVP